MFLISVTPEIKSSKNEYEDKRKAHHKLRISVVCKSDKIIMNHE